MGSSTEHQIRRAEMQRRASAEYTTWVASQPPAERAKLKNLGLDRPPEDTFEVSGHSPFEVGDAAESHHCRTELDIAAALDTPAELLAETYRLTLPQATGLLGWCKEQIASAIRSHEAHLLQVIVGGLLAAKNPKLSAAGLAFASGLDALNGLGCQSEYARANHVSRAAVSKIVIAWQRALGLRKSAHQKSERACTIYSNVATANHWRNRKASATELLRRLNQKVATNS